MGGFTTHLTSTQFGVKIVQIMKKEIKEDYICSECGKELHHNECSHIGWLECTCGFACRYGEVDRLQKIKNERCEKV